MIDDVQRCVGCIRGLIGKFTDVDALTDRTAEIVNNDKWNEIGHAVNLSNVSGSAVIIWRNVSMNKSGFFLSLIHI